MQKKWVLRDNSSNQFKGDFEAPDFVKNILVRRGIKTKEEAEKFFNPSYEKGVYDPFLILNMRSAAEQIISAIKNKEKIIIFGDYDADGICGAAIFYIFLKKIKYENFEVYIPDRYKEGHGLNEKITEEFINKKVELIVTIDCGITNYDAVKKANKAGIKVIITDHHIPPERLPPAIAIVDLYQKEEKCPFKDLSGAAVAFKLVSAILKIDSFGLINGWEKWLLDLVAIATVGDMVPLVDENRALVYYGLKVLGKTRNPGLKLLNQKLNLDAARLSSEDLAFYIAPRLNAASRMDHAATSFYLLITDAKQEADWLVKRLEETNNERRKLVDQTLKELKVIYKGRDDLPEFLFAGNEKWSPGILPLVATRLVEKYDRPAILWGKGSAEMIKGSCRSNGKIDLVELMKNIKEDVFDDFGGHPMAAGFSLKENKIESFEKSLREAFAKTPQKELEENMLFLDGEFSLEDVNQNNYALLEKLEPFGMKNPKPIFLFNGLKIESVRQFGNGKPHLELTFKKSGGEIIKAIGFFMASKTQLSDGQSKGLKSGDVINLAASLDRNYYNGYDELRLKIMDFKLQTFNE